MSIYSYGSRERYNSNIPDPMDNVLLGAILAVGGMAISIFGSSNRWRYLQSSLWGATQQSLLYSYSTPRKEFSKKELFFTALIGGSVELIAQLSRNASYGLLEKYSIRPSALIDTAIQTVTSTVTHISQYALKGEIVPTYGLAAAALSTVGGSAVANCFGLIPIDSIKGLVCREIFSGGSSSAVKAIIFNACWIGPHGQMREWHENVLLSTVIGAGTSGISAAVRGQLPAEINASAQKWKEENRKLRKLQAEAKKEEDSYSDSYWKNKEEIKRLEGVVVEKKEKSIEAHRNFIATGKNEQKWKDLQAAAGKEEENFNSQRYLIERQNSERGKQATASTRAAEVQSEIEAPLCRAVFDERNTTSTIEHFQGLTITSMPLYDIRNYRS